MHEDFESLSVSVTHWNTKENNYKEEIEQLKEHKKNLKERRKELVQEVKRLKESDASLRLEKEDLRMEIVELKKECGFVYGTNDLLSREITRVVLVLVAEQARHNRTFAAVSKIFVDHKDATEPESITDTERTVIDHCLRQLTNQERAKFLCECERLDGGFVFRNQIRREMDAIMRDPERLRELMRDGEDTQSTAKLLHDAVKGGSPEVQKREKRKGKCKH